METCWFRPGCLEPPVAGVGRAAEVISEPLILGQNGRMVLVGVHALTFRHRGYENAKALDAGLTLEAKLAAILSQILVGATVHYESLIALDS